MQKRRLGHSDIHTAPLVVGGNIFGWTVDETASFRILDEFVAAGFDFIDTADVYSKYVPGNVGGESEAIIGKWLHQRGNRARVVLATKVGMQMGPGKEGLSKAYIFRAVEDSLRRLQTDYIDLYQSHMDDAATPLQETLQAFAELIQQGKVRAIGASNYQGARLAEALDLLTQRGYAILHALDEVAKSHHTTPAAVALAWLIARPSITAPIVSATNSAQLQTLVEATQLKLDSASIAALDGASAEPAADQ